MSEFTKETKAACTILKKGGAIIYPTDTIWGIGCDATNTQAVKKIYSIKQRNSSKSMVVLVNNIDMLKEYIIEIPIKALGLIHGYSDPLTIVYPFPKNLSSTVLAPDGSAGIRICKDLFCMELIKLFGKPIVSTSANVSGTEPPETFGDITENILLNADYVVNLRRNEIAHRNPSAVIKITPEGKVVIIRR